MIWFISLIQDFFGLQNIAFPISFVTTITIRISVFTPYFDWFGFILLKLKAFLSWLIVSLSYRLQYLASQ